MRGIEIVVLVLGFLGGLAYALSYKLTNKKISISIKSVASALFVLLGFLCLKERADGFSQMLIIALIFGAVADIVFGMRHVVEKKRKPIFFNFGVSLFAIGHIVYIIAINLLVDVPIWLYAIALPMALAICFIPKLIYKTKYGRMRYVIFAYAAILSAMLLCAIYYAALTPSAHNSAMLVAAAALFAISDFILLFEIFVKDNFILNIANLLTYYSGQLLFALCVGYLIR